ncbi:conserved hypothetical protein [Pyrobaculum islandicum DSM 4184]|uniref:Uncharacterized protein n=1 Tax=Pyrobaculum islandicum (strain DSM 4184 / JCM 9189 / GEO3) TaxID=384616 RepID=A1RTC9_PYRIL|nr:conserved hypothetical protein [Pyrobaculum islandicum DSM 4184]
MRVLGFNLPPYDSVVLIRIGEREERIESIEDLERLCKLLREELQKERCQYHSWYIRISPERLFALLKKAYVKYTQGVIDVSSVIAEFLDENKLSRSLSRTITPTLSSLGITTSGKFTAIAVEIGRLFHEGKIEEAKARFRELVYRNCILKEVIEKTSDCSELEKAVTNVLTAYGKSIRFDELKYTAELLKFIHPKCENCDFRCITPEKISACVERLIQLLTPHMRELFEKLDISLLPEHLDFVNTDSSTFIIGVKGTEKHIGLVLIGNPIESADLQQLKNALARLEEKIAEGVYEVYVKILPILEGGEKCKSVKLLLEVVRGDLERVSKFIKLSS